MKTREQIYGKEAAEIIRCVSSFHCVRRDQLKRIFPESGDKLDILLTYLLRQERIYHAPDKADIFYDSPEMETDTEMLSAISVLCDFAERAEYFSVGEYPVKIFFFADGELYDVLVVPPGKEALVNCAAREQKEDSQCLVIVEDIEQAEKIDIPNIAAFCTVDVQSGEVEYYKLEE